MPLHLKGSQLVVDLLDAADHLDHIRREEHQALLRRAADTVAALLKQDFGNPTVSADWRFEHYDWLNSRISALAPMTAI